MPQIPVTFCEKERIWSGPPESSIFHEDASLGRIIFNNMKNWPNNVCQIWDSNGEEVTFGQVLTWAIRIAQFFKKRGLTQKDVVGIAAENSKYLMSLGVACMMNGTPFHSPHQMLGEETVRHELSITKPGLIFCDGNVYGKVHSATSEWQPEFFTLTDHLEGVPSIETLLEPTSTEDSYQPEPLREGGGQTVAILCSSGTTGLPKAVCISNCRLIPTPSNIINSETIYFAFTALHWISGLLSFAHNAVLGLTRIMSTDPFNPENLVRLLKKYKIEVLSLMPRHINVLITCPEATPEAFSSLRAVIFGGGFTASSTLERFQRLCPNAELVHSFAMTEAGQLALGYGIENGNSVGRPYPGVKIRIVGDNGENRRHNQMGEIYALTGRVWNGYYGNPKATESLQDAEGWFHTGDLGYFNEQNLLYLVDRCKDNLKYQSIHYWPSEIESVISELNEVQEVCVVGIPNEVTDDDAGALVVRSKGSAISAQEIVDHVASRLTTVHQQLHAGVQFTDSIPVNANGKMLRRAARDLFMAKKANTE
ncbi:4-coumarate--CoA ligase 1-like isoform X1 [Drosophila serrata]|uniref:4-coumarate--CoA ligase 1-like isoform X1 n=1 Tax=Drosophila serrata TaxID=7274 RepID=UPI000A1D0405|nr:4-coumarate--CoA ligase 1-like isoform X1 [Drosophila serrata]